MPADPSTWTDGAYNPVSASKLNGDLYVIGDSPNAPNGVRFHATRPLYDSFAAGANSVAATSWDTVFNGTNSTVMIDSPTQYAAPFDPPVATPVTAGWGSIRSNLSGSGGAAGVGGGWYLLSAFVPINCGTLGNGFMAGLTKVTGTPTEQGNDRRGDAGGTQVCPYVIDLISMGADIWTASVFNGDTAAKSTVTSTDGSLRTPRFSALWCSVATGGSVVSAPAPKRTWASTDTWTAAFANGSTGIRDVLRALNMPPVFKGTRVAAQSIVAGNVATVVALDTVNLDTYSGWNAGTSTYTVQRPGIYLVYAYTSLASNANGGTVRASARINAADFWGPSQRTTADSRAFTSGKIQLFSLNANDTIQLVVAQSTVAAANTLTSAQVPTLLVIWLGAQGTPSGSLPTPPDINYRYTAGTAPDLSSVLNTHLANDLTFLIQRPYLLTYQNVAAGAYANGVAAAVNMDTVQGIVHADAGDNYSGWNATTHLYTAPVNGWYLFVTEVFMAFASTANPTVEVAIQISNNSPTNTFDSYERNSPPTATTIPGASGLGYYYLRAGDTIQPWAEVGSYTATTVATVAPAGNKPHFGVIWVSE